MKKIIFIILIILWMITIFAFSNQESKKSKNISEKSIEFIIDRLPSTKDLPKLEKKKKIEDLQLPVRKLAHFSIYTIGGVISFIFVNEFNIEKKKKILFSLAICAIYAVTDEFHQSFVSGRSCELRDVLIDSSGALLGIAITYLILQKYKRSKEKCNKVDIDNKMRL